MKYTSDKSKAQVAHTIEKALGRALLASEILISKPPEYSMGDFAFGCFALAKNEKKSPADFAKELAEKITLNKDIEKLSVAGPYINFYIATNVYQQELKTILKEKHRYGKMSQAHPETIMVEFGQPNTHKAFHVGHLKSAISGLGIVRLLENQGHKVIKANYFGDVGMHVAKTTWGMQQRGIPKNIDSWDVHIRMKFIDEGYVLGAQEFETDDNAVSDMKKINNDIYSGTKSESAKLYNQIREWSLEHLTLVFKELGIEYDIQYPESEFYNDAVTIVESNKGSLFRESKGALIYDGKKEGLTTWVFLTQEGNPTYSAKDLALGLKKFSDYSLDKNITLTSVEQIDYFKVVIKCIETLEPKLKGKYVHLPFGWLLRDNKKTSSRKGGTIKGMDIIDEAQTIAKEKIDEIKKYSKEDKERIANVVAKAGLKFMILSHELHKNINYDPKKFISFEGFSGPYILYAYVRAKSLLNKGKRSIFKKPNTCKEPEELAVLKKLADYPDIAKRAAENFTPHILCTYLHELASVFNLFYAHCPVLDAEKSIRDRRLELTEATSHVLHNGLSLLGIDTVEEM